MSTLISIFLYLIGECFQNEYSALNIDNKFIPEDLRSISHRSRDDKQLLKDILVLGQQIVLVRNVKDLFHHIISSVNRLIGAERGAIFLLEDDSSGKHKFRLRASINLTPEQIDDPGFAPSIESHELPCCQWPLARLRTVSSC
jgi:hypothetical protein